MATRKRKGRAIRKVKAQDRGLANQVASAAQGVYGQAADAARNGAVELHQWSRNAIRSQPYTTTLTVFGAGWLLGEMGLLLGGKTRGIDRLFGRNPQPSPSITLRILAAALVDIGPAGR